jgi:Dyp-type peroxidase family
VFLSGSGYKALEFPEEKLTTGFRDLERWGRFQFLDGMAAHATLLGDPASCRWEPVYRDQKIHVMILLAHNNKRILSTQKGQMEKDTVGVAEVLAVEWGHRLRRGNTSVEPFGYADGLSQPHFFVTSHGDFAPLDLVLLDDPLAPADVQDCYGSYLVFRKLEQNVCQFNQFIRELAKELRCSIGLAEALVMGRFKDGTPLALADQPGNSKAATNNFSYHQDPNGTRCPFHAHIRRLNPRGETAVNLKSFEDDAEELRHRIVRRGISYGTETVPSDPLPETDVGTLFMCFQRSISNQFGFLQRAWANSTTKPGVQVPIGVDPLIGQRRLGQSDAGQPRWPLRWGGKDFRYHDFKSSVILKGGEFLFAPSLPFFAHSLR